MARKDALFFMDVTPATKMRPAGKSGPSLALSRLDVKQFEPVGMHPGGKILPSFRLDGLQSETTLETNASASQKASAAEPADWVTAGLPDWAQLNRRQGNPADWVRLNRRKGNPVDSRIALPMHNTLTSTALGDALDGAKSDPKKIARRLHVN